MVCELNFPTKVLAIKMNRKRLVVLLEERIHIYDIQTMNIVHTIETIPNPNGITLTISTKSRFNFISGLLAVCAYSSDSDRPYLAYPTNHHNGELAIFDTVSLQAVCAIQAHKSPISAVVFNFDGTLLATASDKAT